MLSIYFLYSLPALDDAAISGWAFWGATVMLVALWGLVGLVVVAEALTARKRFYLRLRAFRGDQEAMPRAAMRVVPERAPDLANEPVTLMWRATRLGRLFWAACLCLVCSVVGFSIWCGFLLASFLPTFQGTPHVYALPLLSPAYMMEGRVIVVALWLVLLGFSLGAFAFIVVIAPGRLGKRYGVVATTEGIFYRPQELGRSWLLRWEEIRLVEVAEPGKGGPQKVRVYGPLACVQWQMVNPFGLDGLGVAPDAVGWDGVSERDLWTRHQALLNLIVARTHLLPRTFEEQAMLAGSAKSALNAAGPPRS
jgi:hypothetical protein